MVVAMEALVAWLRSPVGLELVAETRHAVSEAASTLPEELQWSPLPRPVSHRAVCPL